jgi:hypothetical protein
VARFRNGFVFDDVFMIASDFVFDAKNLPRALVNRTMIISSLDKAVGRPEMDTYRPLSVVSFFWDAALSERSPWSYHLSNALMHCLVCALLLALLRQLLPELPQRLSGCLVAWFGLSPWLAEAHVWISGRSDPLLAAGFLLSLLCMRRALTERRMAPAVAAAGALLAALLSKEIAVVLLPFVVAVPAGERASGRDRLRFAWPLLAALALYLGLRIFALSGLRSHTHASQLLLAAQQLPLVLLDGLRYLIAPTPYFLRSMRDDYAEVAPWQLGLAWLALVALTVILLRCARRAYTLVWSASFSLVALAPAALISTVLWPGFGRYLYAPALGLTIALGAALQAWLQRSPSAARRAWPALLACTGLFGLLLLDATLTFADEQALYARARTERPSQAWTHGFMGMALKREKRCREAIPLLNRAAEMDAAEPRYALRLGQCLLETGAIEPARDVARAGRTRFSGTRSEPGFLVLLVRTLPSTQVAEQRALLQRCLAVDPERSDCAQLLALLARYQADGAAHP